MFRKQVDRSVVAKPFPINPIGRSKHPPPLSPSHWQTSGRSEERSIPRFSEHEYECECECECEYEYEYEYEMGETWECASLFDREQLRMSENTGEANTVNFITRKETSMSFYRL